MAFFRNRVFLIAVVLLLLGAAGRWAWTRHGNVVRSDERFRVTEYNLHVTERPTWIHSDVTRSAILAGELDRVSLLDHDAVEKVAAAFQVQTWVASVNRVTKSPAGVTVDLTFREPMAMVEISADGQPKLQPIDDHGVLLPGAEFSQAEAGNYLRLAVPQPRLHGLIDGMPWPDDRILHGAKVAAALNEHRNSLQLFRVQLVRDGGRSDKAAVFEVQARNGVRVVWGSAPGKEVAGEADATSRLRALRSLQASLIAGDEQAALIRYDVRTGSIVQSDVEPAMVHGNPAAESNPWGLPATQ